MQTSSAVARIHSLFQLTPELQITFSHILGMLIHQAHTTRVMSGVGNQCGMNAVKQILTNEGISEAIYDELFSEVVKDALTVDHIFRYYRNAGGQHNILVIQNTPIAQMDLLLHPSSKFVHVIYNASQLHYNVLTPSEDMFGMRFKESDFQDPLVFMTSEWTSVASIPDLHVSDLQKPGLIRNLGIPHIEGVTTSDDWSRAAAIPESEGEYLTPVVPSKFQIYPHYTHVVSKEPATKRSYLDAVKASLKAPSKPISPKDVSPIERKSKKLVEPEESKHEEQMAILSENPFYLPTPKKYLTSPDLSGASAKSDQPTLVGKITARKSNGRTGTASSKEPTSEHTDPGKKSKPKRKQKKPDHIYQAKKEAKDSERKLYSSSAAKPTGTPIPHMHLMNSYQRILHAYSKVSTRLTLTREVPVPDVTAIKSWFTFLFDIGIETHMNMLYQNQASKMGRQDFKLTTKEGGKTPDFVWYDEKVKKVRVVEYKSTLGRWSVPNMESIQNKLTAAYTSEIQEMGLNPEDYIIEFHFLSYTDTSITQTFKADRAIRSLLSASKTMVQNLISLMPHTEFKQLKGKYIPDLSEVLLRDLDEHMGDHISDPGNLQKTFKSTEDYVEEFIQVLPQFDTFLNHKYVPTAEMCDYIDPVSQPNIDPKNPWDRDAGKAYAASLGRPHEKGHRSNFLLYAPTMWETESIDQSELEDLVLKTKNPIWGELNDIKQYRTQFHLELDMINHMFLRKAYMKTEAGPEAIRAEAEALNCKPDARSVSTELETRIKLIVADISARTGDKVQVSKHGSLVIQKEWHLMAKAHVDYQKKGKAKSSHAKKLLSEWEQDDIREEVEQLAQAESEPRLEWSDSFKLVEDDLDHILTDPVSLTVPDFLDAYPHNESRNRLSNLLVKMSSDTIKEVMSQKGFGIMYRWQKLINTIIASVPRSATKTDKSDAVFYGRCPHSGVEFLSTPAPNELTSGAIILFGKISAEKWNDSLTIPWVGPIHVHRTLKYVYYYTDPVRLNYQAAMETQGMLWGLFATACLSNTLHNDLYKDPLYWSLGWNFSRQVVWALDVLYLWDKAVYLRGSFGKDDIKGKVEIIPRDVRASTIIKRLLQNHVKYAADAYRSTSERDEGQLTEIEHPVFNCKLTGWYSMMTISYLKQLMTKRDGADPTQLMAGFYENELKYETWYMDSPFHPSRWDHYKDHSMSDFMASLLEKGGKEWTKLSMHSGVIYRMNEQMTAIAQSEGTKTEATRDWNSGAINTGKNSKVLTPSRLTDWCGVKEEHFMQQAKQSQYSGIMSHNLTEALIMEQSAIKQAVKAAKDGHSYFRVDLDNIPDLSGTDRQLTMKEMSLFGIAMYPTAVIVTMKLKDQKGYGKRAFFVQFIYNRNANRVWDYTARPLLISSANHSDLVTVPGMEKYIEMQKRMLKLGSSRGDMAISKDQTKFGDTYMVECMKIQIIQWRDSGFISQSEFKMLMYFGVCMQSRIVLAPYEMTSSIGKINKKLESNQRVSLKEYRHAMWIKEGEFSSMLNPAQILHSANQSVFLKDLNRNMGHLRASGGVLGVFNMVWSSFSSQIVLFTEHVCQRLFKRKVFVADTHSDDAQDHTVLPVPPDDAFKETEAIPTLIRLCSDGSKLSAKDKEYIIVTTPEGEEIHTRYPAWWLSKLFIAITLLVPRLFSQRPSLMKVNIGIACEMLQQISSSNHQIYIPLVRYTASIGAEMVGLSPIADTYSAMGRVYDLVVNGAPAHTVSTILLLLNMMISSRFGLDDTKRSINKPVELLGLYWATPDHILRYGFSSNLARLLATARHPHYRTLKREMSLLLHTTDIWRSFKKEAHERAKSEATLILTEEESEMDFSAPEVFIQFNIHYNRVKKTSIALDKILDIVDEDLTRMAGVPGVNRHDALNVLIDKFGVLGMTNSSSYIHKVVNTLRRYRSASFSDKYIRISPDSAFIQRWGYGHRIIPVPFSLEVQSSDILKPYINGSLDMSIYSVFETVTALALSDYELPPLNKKGYEQLQISYAEAIDETLNFYLDFEVVPRPKLYEDVQAAYRDIDPPDFLSLNPKWIVYALWLIVNRLEYPDAPDTSRLLFSLEPHLLHDEVFLNHVTVMKSVLYHLGISTSKSINRHARMITNLYRPMIFHPVMKIPYGKEWIYEYLIQWFSWDKMLRVRQITTSGPTHGLEIKIPIVHSLSNLSRPMLLTLWECQLSNIRLKTAPFLSSGSNVIRIDLYTTLQHHLTNFRFEPSWSSDLLVLLLWGHAFEGLTLSAVRMYGYEYPYSVFSLRIGPWWDMFLIGSEGVPTKNTKWKIRINTEQRTSPSVDISTFIPAMMYFVSSIMLNAESRITSMDQIDDLQGDILDPLMESINFIHWGKGEPLEVRATPVPQGFHRKDIGILAPDVQYQVIFPDDDINQFTGVILYAGIQFPDRLKPKHFHFATPWRIRTTHSMLIAYGEMISSDLTDDFYPEDEVNFHNPVVSVIHDMPFHEQLNLRYVPFWDPFQLQFIEIPVHFIITVGDNLIRALDRHIGNVYHHSSSDPLMNLLLSIRAFEIRSTFYFSLLYQFTAGSLRHVQIHNDLLRQQTEELFHLNPSEFTVLKANNFINTCLAITNIARLNLSNSEEEPYAETASLVCFTPILLRSLQSGLTYYATADTPPLGFDMFITITLSATMIADISTKIGRFLETYSGIGLDFHEPYISMEANMVRVYFQPSWIPVAKRLELFGVRAHMAIKDHINRLLAKTKSGTVTRIEWSDLTFQTTGRTPPSVRHDRLTQQEVMSYGDKIYDYWLREVISRYDTFMLHIVSKLTGIPIPDQKVYKRSSVPVAEEVQPYNMTNMMAKSIMESHAYLRLLAPLMSSLPLSLSYTHRPLFRRNQEVQYVPVTTGVDYLSLGQIRGLLRIMGLDEEDDVCIIFRNLTEFINIWGV